MRMDVEHSLAYAHTWKRGLLGLKRSNSRSHRGTGCFYGSRSNSKTRAGAASVPTSLSGAATMK
ncbi:hypothetical protein LR69_02395 [Geobacillus sp. BCO2]|nr:hypothetical protein LR69_02395 [Geobacillus sp. BCO2]